MSLVKHNDMIQQIPAAVADPAFRNPVLPRASKACSLRLDAETLYSADNFIIEVCGTVEDQIPRKACPAQRALIWAAGLSEQQAADVKPGSPKASPDGNTNHEKSDRR
jgi:hypothetical protein